MGGDRRPALPGRVAVQRSGAWRRQRLSRAQLYVVTGARESHRDLDAFLDAVLRGGAGIIQLREKDADARDLLRWGSRFREAARSHDALFIVNDRADIALALDADGVHLGQDDLPAETARQILGPDRLIGLSTHTIEQFAGASAQVDYLCAGPVHLTPTKPGRAATGLALIAAAAGRHRSGLEARPWFAIGGLGRDTLPEVITAGADRAVVVRAVDSADPESSARALRRLLARVPTFG